MDFSGFSFGAAEGDDEETTRRQLQQMVRAHRKKQRAAVLTPDPDSGHERSEVDQQRYAKRRSTFHLVALAKLASGGIDASAINDDDNGNTNNYCVQTVTDSGDPIWLSKSSDAYVKKGPAWERPNSAALPPLPARNTFSVGNRAHAEETTGRHAGPHTCDHNCADCKFVRDNLDTFEKACTERKKQERDRLRRASRVGMDQMKQSMGGGGGGGGLMSGRNLFPLDPRQLQINELRSSNLVNRLITAKKTIMEIKTVFEKYVDSFGELSRDNFELVLRALDPDIGDDQVKVDMIFTTFDTDDSETIDFVEFFSLLGLLLSPPEKDLEIQYLFDTLDINGRDKIPKIRLTKKYLMSLKQAKASRQRWRRLASEWAMLEEDLPSNLTLDYMRMLVFSHPSLLAAHEHLRPTY
eukprot:TRINITY_DN66502_c6_g3_i1.p1 TRINITY_DN66502_c6_g3~~TRINITY_DN66502_c6_g3_i1.p1  ORF type:complete len:410 (-),score=41.50 TRINITY_DN66502_c6_g3_i1:152-1381(-)